MKVFRFILAAILSLSLLPTVALADHHDDGGESMDFAADTAEEPAEIKKPEPPKKAMKKAKKKVAKAKKKAKHNKKGKKKKG